MARKIPVELVETLDTYKATFWAKGDNIVEVDNAGRFERTILSYTIKMKNAAAAQYTFVITMAGIPIYDTAPTVESGKFESVNCIVDRATWESGEDLQITIPDLSGNEAFVDVLYSWKPAEELPASLNAPVESSLTVASGTSLDFTWTDTNTSPQESQIEVQYGHDQHFETHTQVLLAAGTLTDELTGLTTDQLAYARVRALGNGTTTGNSRWSGILSETPIASSSIAKIGTNVFLNNTNTDPDSTTLSYTQVSGTNRGMFALVIGEGTMPESDCTATYGGQSMTRIPRLQQVGSFVMGFYLEEANLPSDGANDIVLSHPNYTGSSICLYAGQISGCQWGQSNTVGVSDITISNAAIVAFNGSYAISGFTAASSSTTAISENLLQNQLIEGLQNGHRISIAELENVTSGSKTFTSSFDSPTNHIARILMLFSPKQ